jgi:hypothetical protein
MLGRSIRWKSFDPPLTLRADASPVLSEEVIFCPLKWVTRDVFTDTLPLLIVTDDAFVVITLPDPRWGEASALFERRVLLVQLADASPVQSVNLPRGDRFEVLDDRA